MSGHTSLDQTQIPGDDIAALYPELHPGEEHSPASNKSANVRRIFEQRREEEELLRQIRDICDEDT